MANPGDERREGDPLPSRLFQLAKDDNGTICSLIQFRFELSSTATPCRRILNTHGTHPTCVSVTNWIMDERMVGEKLIVAVPPFLSPLEDKGSAGAPKPNNLKLN